MFSGVTLLLCVSSLLLSFTDTATAQRNGDLRLARGTLATSASSGRLEIYINEVWGTVCDDSFSIVDADVACRQLGYISGASSTITARDNSTFGSGSGQIWLDDVGCTGSESCLLSCSNRGIGSHNCVHFEDVAISCSGTRFSSTDCSFIDTGPTAATTVFSSAPRSGDLRLARGSFVTTASSGRLEIYISGVWGTVCDDFFSIIDADVACRQLGYISGASSTFTASTSSLIGQGSGTIWLDDVGCTGSESCLLSCSNRGIGSHNCAHSEDVAISCSGTRFSSTDCSFIDTDPTAATEDCPNPTGAPCDENANCNELRGPNNFTCTCFPFFVGNGFMCRPESMVGDDPHFSIVLASGKLLCYTVQGEHGFVFNLISSKKLSMNAMFVPDSRREEVTWLGSMGIIVRNSGYKTSNATYLRFETKGKKIYIGDKVVLEAKHIEKLSFNNDKLTISEAPLTEGFKYPCVDIDLRDVGLNFTIKFMNEHLDLFWHSTGHETKDSHGLIGQFFRKEVEVDIVRKILILPGKEPVPVMRRPVWSFMEREVIDDQLCWTAMNPGYQGQGLIDGTYLDYLVNDVFSTDFKFKKRQ